MSRLPSPRQRADGRWEAQFRLPGGGRKSVYGATEEACRSKLLEALTARQRGETQLDERTTLTVFLDKWLEAISIDLRPHTLRFYGDQVRLHIKPTLGTRAVAKISRNDVQALVNAKSAEGLSPRMVRHIRSTLRAALNHAEEEGLIRRGSNPAAAHIRLPRLDQDKRPNAMTPDQVRQLLASAEEDQLRSLWMLCATVGLRQAEALGLQWSDIEQNGTKLVVSGQLQRQNGRLERVPYTKTNGSTRTIALPAPVVVSLEAHKLAQHKRQAASPVWKMDGYIFSTGIGGPLEPRNVIRSWHAALKKAGLPRFRFHDLRHTAATNMIRAGIDIKTVAQILGHKDATMVLRTYQHVQTDHLEDAARKMEAVLA